MTTLTLQPNAAAGLDTHIDNRAFAVNTNYGTSTTLDPVSISPDYTHTLFKFDLSSIPAGTTIDSAILSLWNNTQIATSRTVTFYSILSANSSWLELQATWNRPASGLFWAGDVGENGGSDAGCSVAGVDYNSASLGTITHLANDPVATKRSASLNTAQVQAWLTGNYGLIGIMSPSQNYQYRSSDHATASTRPELVVEYTPAGLAVPVMLTSDQFAGGVSL